MAVTGSFVSCYLCFPLKLILEEHIMSSVRPLARTYTERPAEDLRLKEVCEALASATQEQLGYVRCI